MRINSNTSGISSASESFFGSRVRQSQATNTQSTYTGAYNVDISNRAMMMLKQYEDEEVATFNPDVLNYTKDLKLNFKY